MNSGTANIHCNIPEHLIAKYNVAVPRYTSYPPANRFNTEFGEADYLHAVRTSNERGLQNISFYIHVPFCRQLCLYCGCNTQISTDDMYINSYIGTLKAEINMIVPLLHRSRRISQIHWGGGTPNTLKPEIIGEIMHLLTRNFRLTDDAEISIECHPAYLNAEYISALAGFGFNRISLGIQDFDVSVLSAVRRQKPAIEIELLCDIIRRNHISLNFDLMYGLPYQTAASFAAAIDRALAIAPDRLVTFSYAHIPWLKPAQKALETVGLPSADAKMTMFEQAWTRMLAAGYVSIGLDHYAAPSDPLATALKTGTLHRNFQGYCTRQTTGQVYAFGATGISQLDDVYAQNCHSIADYSAAIAHGKLPVEKGYRLNLADRVAREAINEIMCNRRLAWPHLAAKFDMTTAQITDILQYTPKKLRGFFDDGLLSFSDDGFEILDTGRFFLRNIAAVFDINLHPAEQSGSKAV
ncbi:MAG: oxygen-independent coproporphyrinogen III oxidase [Bacteroidales bacterium]|jgi:oxygen-independent coproporphyrinogen-3 oxidase|nr:oxygen-independent coproporphyrinogen III oxidase [Bacteroidales bacterium]